ncbi:acyl carrier protein [Oscillochloris sp. ZM17-4]|uniref:acyl carrier protein n=1 Tax=Oscillochloris sp. ZM17-4 TaxID=2866714 RepID=UPI001C73AD59|nr:acyl carrier protein [Oscillochloris sp. ZM17-4]MBX0331339.1 acyl carrier protein [Oscillochloris sp. ZM17-4]
MNRFALRKIVAEGLEIDPELLEPDTDMTTLEEFNSVAVLMLMLALDAQAGIKMSPEDASRLRYYRDVEALADRQGIVLTE